MNQTSPASRPVVDGSADYPLESAHSLPIADFQLSIVEGKCRNAKKSKRRNGITNRSPPKTDDEWEEKIREIRRRQKSVATILDRTFGRFPKCHPDLWERRAYLMLVGVMYQWLAANEKAVSTEELVDLSKMLAEQRRAEAQSRERAEIAPAAAKGEGELPEDFGEVVKQIYGTNLHTPA